jgi:hypothetical protein
MSKIILLAGYPRSGTTWFANLFNAHSEIIYRHELIGRNFKLLENEIFLNLKFNFGLDDSQYKKVKQFIVAAHVDTDKPPFFEKKQGLLRFPKLHHYAWLVAKTLRFLSPLYSKLFSLNEKIDINYLIKETRSLESFESILRGLRTDVVIFLVRKPEGVIASNITGINKGKMDRITSIDKVNWLQSAEFQQSDISKATDINPLNKLSDIEFLSLQWIVYHEQMLKIFNDTESAKVCLYDDFLTNTFEKTSSLFSDIGIGQCKGVANFIEESAGKKEKDKNLFEIDSSNDFYSVYRKQEFNSNTWKSVLSESEQIKIKDITSDMYKQIKSLASNNESLCVA